MNRANHSGTQKRAEHVARAIEDRIVELGWPVGQLIGSEQSLMVEHGASRGVLREAVRLLEHHGTARMRRGPGGGLVVEKPSAHAVRRSASLLLQYQRIELASLLAARTALELTCFDMIRDSALESADVGLLMAVPPELIEGPPAAESAWGFHTALVRRAGNGPLALFAESLIEMHGEAVDGAPQDPEQLLLDSTECQRDHDEISEAMAVGDWTRARASLEGHLAGLAEISLETEDHDQLMA